MSDSADSLYSEYINMLQTVALRFQFIEEVIKMYISYCYEIIILQLNGRLPFKFSYKDVTDMPLGGLIRQFKKFNANAKLASELERLVKDRNHFAHRGYLMTSDEMHDPIYLVKELARVKAVASKAELAMQAVFQELKAIETLKREPRETGTA